MGFEMIGKVASTVKEWIAKFPVAKNNEHLGIFNYIKMKEILYSKYYESGQIETFLPIILKLMIVEWNEMSTCSGHYIFNLWL